MPATDKTWYDQKLLHVIFGCTSVVMLISTIWMIAQDHERSWKGHQREFRDIQRKQLVGRLRAEERNQSEIVQQAEHAFAAEQSKLPAEDLVEEFKDIAAQVGEFSFTQLDEDFQELTVQAGNVDAEAQKYEAAQVTLREARSAAQNAGDEERAAALGNVSQAELALDAAESALIDAQTSAKRLRGNIFARLEKVTKEAKFQMDEATNGKKLTSAQFDAVKARQGLLYGKEDFDGAAAMQSEVDAQREVLDAALAEQERTTSNRNKLRGLITDMSASETAAKKALDDARAEETRLEGAIDELNINYFSLRTLLGKKLLEIPVVDGFNGPLKIDNLWTDGLMMPNGSFGNVRRFDRCTTCHKGIDKTAPGSATMPAYEQRHEVVVQIQTPEDPPAADATLEDVYGIVLSSEGLVDRNDVAIEYVVANSLAASAINVSDAACANGLMESDAIRFVGGDAVDTVRDAVQFLMDPVDGWGSVVEVVVDRGLPEPYSSHPRLDLYVGSLSPHKMTDIGCTVCHEGQGSGTSFNYASHTPDSLEQEEQWWKEYGWFSNHHWIFPMHPARFAESSCLKCHHDVVELGASEKYPETPAPKLLAGHNLIQAYGCFGCHEINGYKTPTERIGPDLRLEPNYFAAAAELAHDPTFKQLSAEQQALARHLVYKPEDNAVRHQLLDVIASDAASETPQLSAAAHKLAEVLGDIETPGELRKAGPSLRHIGSKVGKSFLYDWIREPKNFRPGTKMPQFFGLWNHIKDEPKALEQAQKYEPIEIMGIVTYLLDRSQPMLGSVDRPSEVNAADAARGKVAFETRGCLACHEHAAFDDANHGVVTAQPREGVSRQLQGPDLTNIGDKLNLLDNPEAESWLYTWLRNPSLYHPRTKMPDTFLVKEKLPDGTFVDPAADVAAFLLSSSNGWKPDESNNLQPAPVDVEEVALEYLSKAFFAEDAKRYLKEGIPEEIGSTLKGSEVELVNRPGDSRSMDVKLLNYVGAKAIGKYGCYGCHDIPGFEGAKPIGVALADWGRKDASKIAFEHIAEYISHGHGGGHGDDAHGDDGHGDDQASHAHGEGEIDEHFYTHRMSHHDRTGFIWQKLKEPRSYDYKKVLNKDYNEKLRMPQFPFNDVEREQVITFILGLVAEPPAEKFVFRPNDRQRALIEGQKVLDKYNCAACHMLETEKWDIEYRSGELAMSSAAAGYEFANAHFGDDTIAASESPHKQRGTMSATLEGMPTIAENGQPSLFEYEPTDIDEAYPFEIDSSYDYDHTDLMRSLTLWSPTAIEGEVAEAGVQVRAFPTAIKQRRRPIGGDLALRLLPRVLELERGIGTAIPNAGTAWGWLPPPLHNEGVKVQADWLHSFLLDPTRIRPGAVMRMPKFNMSATEATALVNYFAAKDDATFPYEYVERTSAEVLDQLDEEYAAQGSNKSRFDSAMEIVTSGANGCVKCHVFGDYVPGGAVSGSVARGGNTAPNLENVYKRLRRDFVRPWVANPARILPYTPMNVVIAHDNPDMWQPSYKGSSVEQLDGVVDLLMNYDRYMKQRSSIKGMVKTDPAPQTAAVP